MSIVTYSGIEIQMVEDTNDDALLFQLKYKEQSTITSDSKHITGLIKMMVRVQYQIDNGCESCG